MIRLVRLVVVALAVCVVAGSLSLLGVGEARAIEVGGPAPAFSLPGSDGATHSLDAHRGKRAVVLAWFPKAFTPG